MNADVDLPIVEATERAKSAAGGPSVMSRELTKSGEPVSPQAISKWTRVPAERVLEVERLSGVSRHELRPDVFGPALADAAVAS